MMRSGANGRLHLYGADTWDATFYDLVIHLKSITVDDAVSLITACPPVSPFSNHARVPAGYR